RAWVLGHGEPRVRLRVRDTGTLRRMLFDPSLRFGEAWVDGEWTPEGCTLRDVLAVAVRLGAHLERARRGSWWRRLRARVGELNSPLRARRNVAHHYDIDCEVYRRFLDADLHYSCAYFETPDSDLEAAQ